MHAHTCTVSVVYHNYIHVIVIIINNTYSRYNNYFVGSVKPSNDSKSSNSSAGSYQAEEYHGHNPYSFYDIELTMMKDRLKQPNPKDSS